MPAHTAHCGPLGFNGHGVCCCSSRTQTPHWHAPRGPQSCSHTLGLRHAVRHRAQFNRLVPWSKHHHPASARERPFAFFDMYTHLAMTLAYSALPSTTNARCVCHALGSNTRIRSGRLTRPGVGCAIAPRRMAYSVSGTAAPGALSRLDAYHVAERVTSKRPSVGRDVLFSAAVQIDEWALARRLIQLRLQACTARTDQARAHECACNGTGRRACASNQGRTRIVRDRMMPVSVG